jgi:aromatic ring hydroxylase
VFEKERQSNARYQPLGTVTFHVHSVEMLLGFCKKAVTSKGRPFCNMTHIKKSIVEVKVKENSLAKALVIVAAKVTNDPN